MLSKSFRVLITGAGGPGAPGIIKSLKVAGIYVIGVDARKNAIGSFLADKFAVIPEAKDKNYISSLLKTAKKFKADVILPTNTAELITLAENKDKFEKAGIRVSISEAEHIKVANNKYLLMREAGVPVPEFYLVKSLREFKGAVKKLKKVCFKPPISNGQRGFRIIKENTFKDVFEEKPAGTTISMKEVCSILKKKFPELLVMEYLPGKEYSVDILADNGKSIVVIPRTRDYIKAGISFEGTTVNHKKIIEYSEKIIERLKLNGNIGFQFKEDKNGIPKLIECNPRLQGTVVINTFAGANLVEMAVRLALGEQVKKPKVKWGLKMIRYWEEVYE